MNTKSNKKFNVRQLTVLGLLTALVMLFSLTPVGSITIGGGFSITLNTIPIALAAITCGPIGGAIIGGIFGIFSFLQCINIGVPSPMGAIMFDIDPLLTFIQRFIPRVLIGLIAGYSFKFSKTMLKNSTSYAITGFLTALSNTVLFMTALVLLFSNTDFLKEKIGGQNIIWFCITFVGINALIEMITATVVTPAISIGLQRAGFIKKQNNKLTGDKK